MKKQVRLFVFFTILALLFSGCGSTKDHEVTETFPPENIALPSQYADVPLKYQDVLHTYSVMGYALLDLDWNGSEELLITDGTQIYAIYSICEDGQMYKKLELAGDTLEIFLCADNRIYVHSADDGGACQYHYVYAMTDRIGNLPMELCVMNFDDRWFAGSNEKDVEESSEAEAKAMLDDLVFKAIEFTPFRNSEG